MLKKFKFCMYGICVVFVLMFSAAAFAAPICPVPVEFTQPNGEVITVTTYGDEFFSWSEDENGNVIAYDEENNSYKYAEIKDDKIVPTLQTVGEPSLFSVFSHKLQREDIMPLWENAERIDYSKPNDNDGIQLMSADETQETDEIKKLLTVLIEFEDVKIKRDGEYWYKHMYSTNPHDISVVNYWKENAEGRDVFQPSDTSTIQDGAVGTISCDKYTDVEYVITKCPKGVVKVSLDMPHPIKTEEDTWEECPYIDELVANILEPYFDFAKQNPYMIMVYATGDGVGNLHDHASQTGIKLSTGFRTQKVVCQREGRNGTYGIGVTCHELGHSAFDLPDLYFSFMVNGGWTHNGIMYYSLMSTGCWGKLCNKFFDLPDNNIWNDPEAYDLYAVPTHLDPWCKMQCGFLTPTIVNEWDGDINSISEMGDNSSYNVIEIRSKADANQYFLIENRQLVGYDAGLELWNDSRSTYKYPFKGGIVIWHIDGSVFEVHNNDSSYHHFMQIEQSIKDDNDGVDGVWEFLNIDGRNKLNADTTPNSNLHERKTADNRSCSWFKDCHPQTLKSGISIEVLGENSTSTRVKVNVDDEYRVDVLDNVKFTDVFPDINFCNAIFDNMKKKDGLKRTPDSMMTIRDWATISAIDDLQMDGYGIKDLTGIEYFPLLDWLVCNNNEIKELTSEQVPNMIFLDCSNNKLTELDLSQWPQLEYLFCDNNQLTELDVSNNERLYSLTCSNNSLKSIDLSRNGDLWELDCSNNKLSNIDITNNTGLAILKCYENFLDAETPANTILGLDAVLEEIGEPLSKDDPDNWFAYYPQKTPEPPVEPRDRVEFERQEDNVVSAKLVFEETTPPNGDNIWLIVACRENGELKFVETPKITDMSADFIIPEKYKDCEISVYVWDKDMQPLMAVQEMK